MSEPQGLAAAFKLRRACGPVATPASEQVGGWADSARRLPMAALRLQQRQVLRPLGRHALEAAQQVRPFGPDDAVQARHGQVVLGAQLIPRLVGDGHVLRLNVEQRCEFGKVVPTGGQAQQQGVLALPKTHRRPAV